MEQDNIQRFFDLSSEQPALIFFSALIMAILVIMSLAIVFGTIRRIIISKHQEHALREIAAYVAEGSLSAEEGERLLNTRASRRCIRTAARHTDRA